MSTFAMLIDSTKCTGCRGCQVACKQWWDLDGVVGKNTGSYENPPDLSAHTYTRIKYNEIETDGNVKWLFLKQGCMHCSEPACVKVCPTQCLKKHPDGMVTVELDLCNGCGYCRTFCPFDIPRIEGDTFTGKGKTSKCNFCQDRTTNGQLPACVKTCPAGALSWGDRDEMLALAKTKVEKLKARGESEANIYGDTQLGGTGRIYVLKAKPEEYGLPKDPTFPIMANAWQDWVQPLGLVVFGLAAVAMGGISGLGAIMSRGLEVDEHGNPIPKKKESYER